MLIGTECSPYVAGGNMCRFAPSSDDRKEALEVSRNTMTIEEEGEEEEEEEEEQQTF